MTLQTYIWCFVAGLLGILFHLFAVKIPAVKNQAKVANLPFSLKDYITDDLAGIVSSVLTVLVFLVVLDEVVAFRPSVLPWLKGSFIFVGFTGSSLLIALLGKATGKINEVVNIKTDVADGKKP